jgi:hypothetical protein
MDKIPVDRPKKRVIIILLLTVLVLAGAGAFFFIHKNKTSKPSAKYIHSKINFNITVDNCKKRKDDLAQTDLSKIDALNAAKILSQRANCYYELGDFKNALATYQEMQNFCKKQSEDLRCGQVAGNGIQVSKDALGKNNGAQVR